MCSDYVNSFPANTFSCVNSNPDEIVMMFYKNNSTDGLLTLRNSSLTFVENTTNGTASINGQVVDCASNQYWDVSFLLSGKTYSSSDPKTSFCGCTQDMSDWYFYSNLSGSVSNGGTTLPINNNNLPKFQVGSGANIVDASCSQYAGSSWFNINNTSSWDRGDIFFNLSCGTNPTCDDVTDGGTINMGNNPAVNCGPYNPSALGSTALPSGGSGDLEYLWLSSTTGCPTSLTQAISGADNATYNPGMITETTYYVRCSRRAGCSTWNNGESNCVTLTVAPDYNVVCEARINNGAFNNLADCTVTVDAGDDLDLSVNPNGADSYAWVGPNGFTATGSAGGDIHIPNITANEAGNYTVTIDVDGCVKTQTITVVVNSVTNNLPTATNDSATTNENTAVTIPVTNNDDFGADGPNNGSIVITNNPNNGTASVDNNGTPNDPTDDSIVYTPNTGYTGSDVLTYIITDSNGDQSTATVDITINPDGGNNGPDCANISITTDNGAITVTGLDLAPVSSVQIFTATWQPVFSCFADCDATETVSVPAGDYLVFVKYYEANYALVCQVDGTFTVTGGGGGNGPCENAGGDSDGDNVCDNDDCAPNNPNLPAVAGTPCDDGNANTVNDVITADGCGCEGTPDNGGGNGPDCNDIAITTGDGTITVTGLDGAPVSSVQIFTATWQPVFSCFADCDATETVTVPAGDYLVFVKYYEATYALVCQEDGTFTVTSGGGGGGNNLPSAEDDTATTNENTGVNIPVTGNDNFGGDGPSNGSIAIVTIPGNGTATVNDNGTPNNPTDDTIDYTPNNGFTGTDTFTYVITDSDGDTSTATVTVTRFNYRSRIGWSTSIFCTGVYFILAASILLFC